MRWSFVVLLVASSSMPALAQTTWHVDAAGCDGAGTGTVEDPFCTIQEAVDVAADGDTVLVGPGTYPDEVSIPGLRLMLRGASGALYTEIACASVLGIAAGSDVTLEDFTFSARGFHCSEATVKIRNCRFLDVVGGGVLATLSDVAVSACLFEGSNASGGGAIYARRGTLRVTDCEFIGPPLGFTMVGGAILLEDGAEATVSDSSFSGYYVVYEGSAIRIQGGKLVLERSLFTDNFTGEYGGAVTVLEADAEIRACVFQDNESDLGWGGAIYFSAGPAFDLGISDCLFERNRAAEGGAVCVRPGFAQVERCVFSENSTGARFYSERGYGGGLLVGERDAPGASFASVTRCVFLANSAFGHRWIGDGRGGAVHGSMQLDNCTLYKNHVGGFYGDGPFGGAVAGGASLRNSIVWDSGPIALEEATIVEWSLVQGGWPGTGNLDDDPRFWDREAGDLRLLPASPCIDAGDPTLLDPDGSRLDLGAYPLEPVRGALGRRPKSSR